MTLPEKTGPFRYDINGLRAFAVMAVVFYHFDIAGFSGGFIGVDVFFVISGFLMTGIIIRSLEAKEFSLGRFYLARARRIIPALLVLCSLLLIVGWFLLVPDEYSQLAKHIRDSLLFISNNSYAKEVGYFDVAAQEKWVLHTWTLSVEWQFYLFLPLFFLLVWKWHQGQMPSFFSLLILLSISLAISIIKTPENPAKYYYLLQSRIWEMAAGGLIFLLSTKIQFIGWRCQWIEFIGMILIVLAIFIFDSSSLWPSWRALLPVIGACLVLLSANQHSLLTRNALAQWLGTCSYSIYLWHWPVVVALVFLEQSHQFFSVLSGLIITFTFGFLSYKLIETPSRKKLAQLNSWKASAILLMTMLVVIIPAMIISNYDFPQRLPSEIVTIAAEARNRHPRIKECTIQTGTQFFPCVYGGDEIKVLLIGDSHAGVVATAAEAALTNENAGIMLWSYAGCPTLFGAKHVPGRAAEGQQCDKFNEWVLAEINNVPEDVPVILISRITAHIYGYNESWQEIRNKPGIYFSTVYEKPERAFLEEVRLHYIESVCTLAEKRRVYLVRPFPEMPKTVPQTMARSWMLGNKQDFTITLEEYHQRHAYIWTVQDEAKEQCGLSILNPLPYLCDEQRCMGSINGRPLYYDNNHFSEYGNKFLTPMFEEVIQ